MKTMKTQTRTESIQGISTEVIRTEQITKIYNEKTIPVQALNNINLSIQQGEFTAIVGPSGCGKTTLLNIIGGLDQATSGKVVIAGTDISRLSENQLINFRLHNIGFVFQAYNLIPVLTAKENVSFIMQLLNKPSKEINQRVNALLTDVGLKDKLDKRPGQLSGGQQQRVAVARALASKPQFILADEPTANLDSASTNTLLDMMLRLNEDEKMTFVFSTHDQRVIERARRVITLEDGHVKDDQAQ